MLPYFHCHFICTLVTWFQVRSGIYVRYCVVHCTAGLVAHKDVNTTQNCAYLWREWLDDSWKWKLWSWTIYWSIFLNVFVIKWNKIFSVLNSTAPDCISWVFYHVCVLRDIMCVFYVIWNDEDHWGDFAGLFRMQIIQMKMGNELDELVMKSVQKKNFSKPNIHYEMLARISLLLHTSGCLALPAATYRLTNYYLCLWDFYYSP